MKSFCIILNYLTCIILSPQTLHEMKPLTDILAKLKVAQEKVLEFCGETMAQRLQSRYAEAEQEINGLKSSVEQLSQQLEHCLTLWESYTSGYNSLSAELSSLEEQARTQFKLQSSFEDKEKQVANAQVGYNLPAAFVVCGQKMTKVLSLGIKNFVLDLIWHYLKSSL